MLDIPLHIHITFIATTILTAIFFECAIWNSTGAVLRKRTNLAALVILVWLIFMSTLSLNKYFMDTTAMPPHLMFPVATSLGFILLIFLMARGRRFMDALSMEWLTWLHIVRIPVELCLWWLAMEKLVPWSMTFEGINFDIVSGITAPFIAYFGIRKKVLSRWIIIGWNFLALALLLNVVINAVLSLASPLQVINMDQPNTAVMHFPFIWLPAFIVPVVLFSHLVAIRRFFSSTRPHSQSRNKE